METALKELYKENHYLKEYVELNFKIKAKMINQYHKYAFNYSKTIDVSSQIEEFIKNNVINESLKKMQDLTIKIEKVFNVNFLAKYDAEINKVLKQYISTVYFTQTQSFYFGIIIGIKIVLIVLCFVIAYYYNIDMDSDAEFKSVFPMFR